MILAPIPGRHSTDEKGVLMPLWQSWFAQLYAYLTGATLNVGTSQITSGTGVPNGVVTGNPGDLYLNKSGGSAKTLYVKESGTGNTGWVGK